LVTGQAGLPIKSDFSGSDVFGKQAKLIFAEFLLLSLLFIPPPESEDSYKNYIFRSITFSSLVKVV